MAITQQRLFDDVMQITQRKGNYDLASGAIVDTSSSIWASCSGIACQRLTADMLVLSNTDTGTTSAESIQNGKFTSITKPDDYLLATSVIVDDAVYQSMAFDDLINGKRDGYCEQGTKILLSASSTGTYTLYYNSEWPISNGLPSTDLSIVPERYYTLLLWETVKQISSFYGDINGVSNAARLYQEAKSSIAGSAVIQYSMRANNRV